MPKYKLIYFKYTGRAENIRMVFEHAGVEYEDVRLDPCADYTALKEKAPFGQFPVLEVDGEVFAQSNAILRYVGQENGLYGGSPLDRLRVDQFLDTMEDICNALYPWWFEKDEKKKEEILQKVSGTTLPKYLLKIEEIVKKNDTGFSVGNSLTISDIALANFLEVLEGVVKCHDFNKYPTLNALQTKVFELPKIKAYMEKRPVTVF